MFFQARQHTVDGKNGRIGLPVTVTTALELELGTGPDPVQILLLLVTESQYLKLYFPFLFYKDVVFIENNRYFATSITVSISVTVMVKCQRMGHVTICVVSLQGAPQAFLIT